MRSLWIKKLITISALLGSTLTFAQTSATNSGRPTLFVVGDSTASSGDRRGWGDPIAGYFNASKINVLNRARAGRSARTFLNEGLWEKVLAEMRSGDYLLIQFGHNDGGAPDQPPARGDLPGIGDEAQSLTMPDDKTEVVRTFGWYIRKFVTDSEAKGAHAIVLSPTVRNIWKENKVERGTGSGRFGRWSQQVADLKNVPFLDATNIIADAYEKMGEEQVRPLFPIDHTHTSQTGADLNASLIVAGLKGMHSPLAQLLSDKGQAVASAPDLARLHLPESANEKLPTVFLIGDSTVRNGRGDGSNGQWGWGEPLAQWFDPAKANLVNRAVGGLSSRTFHDGVYWRRVLDMMKPGDFVIMQFGHNDGGSLEGAQGARVSIPGVGNETQEGVHSFGWYLRQFVAETRAHGATPVICSLVPRKIWKDGKIARSSEDYGKWAADVARSESTPFLDLNEDIAREYDRLGADKVDGLFADEHTHTNRAGAELNASIAATGIRGLRQIPLAQFLAAR
ncbi:MAG: rhamnogalacturonan acetylesterase [Bryobacteraceae bacterium]